jgi:hypothetical protein
MRPDHTWQKSSFSAGDDGDHCIELTDGAMARIALREGDDPLVAMSASPTLVASLIRHLKGER